MSTVTQRKQPKDASPEAAVTPESQRALDVNPYLAGEVISDRYRLTREIGRGGMGVVWVAHSLVLGIDVAVKLIRADIAGPAWASRMAREAQAAARLGHPAMVRVFDFGWTNRGDPFLVMEFVTGDTLAKVIEQEGRLPAIRAVQTLLPIADGLRLAHERSIIHRDIKPDNILLSADGLGRLQPKLLDFGIAKVEQGQTDGKLTLVGSVLGSPEYMSPEQARGLDGVDGRSDVWSLAIALYEMIAGHVPFANPNYNALMQAIINDEPPSLAQVGLVDNGLWGILHRALAKNPDTRYGSMGEFGEALALWLYQHGIKEDLSGNSVRALWLDSPLSHLNGAIARAPSAPVRRARVDSIPTVIRRVALLKGTGRLRLVWVAAGALTLVAGMALSSPPKALNADEPAVSEPTLAPLSSPVFAADAERQGKAGLMAAPLPSSEASSQPSKLLAPHRPTVPGRAAQGKNATKAARDFGF